MKHKYLTKLGYTTLWVVCGIIAVVLMMCVLI